MEWYRGYWELHVMGIEQAREVVREAEQEPPAQRVTLQPNLAGRALAWLGDRMVIWGAHLRRRGRCADALGH